MCVMIRQSDKGKNGMYYTRNGNERAFFTPLCLLIGFNCLDQPHLGPFHVNRQFKGYTSTLPWFLALSSTVPGLTGNNFLFLMETQAHLFGCGEIAPWLLRVLLPLQSLSVPSLAFLSLALLSFQISWVDKMGKGG